VVPQKYRNEYKGLMPILMIVADLILSALLAVTGYAQEPNRPISVTGSTTAPAKTSPSPEKVVLKVDNEQVTQADIDSWVSALGGQTGQAGAPQSRRRLGEQYAMMLLLSRLAVSDHLDSSPDVRRQIAVQRLQLLADAEYTNFRRQNQPKPEEVSQYYSMHQAEFEEAQFRNIFIRKRPEGAKDDGLGLPPPEARARAEAIRKALAAGTDPEKVAKDFNDSKNVFIDPKSRTARRGQLAAKLDKAAFELNESDFSEFEETPQSISFIQVVKRRQWPLNEVSAQIERKLQQQKVETALADLRKKAAVWMDEQYFPALPAAVPARDAQKPAASGPYRP
jgi:hypothetical protein